jgi:hypothetical protein
MATVAILIFVQPPQRKTVTHYGGYSYKVSWRLMKGINIYFKSPHFLVPWQLRDLSNRFRLFCPISFH